MRIEGLLQSRYGPGPNVWREESLALLADQAVGVHVTVSVHVTIGRAYGCVIGKVLSARVTPEGVIATYEIRGEEMPDA